MSPTKGKVIDRSPRRTGVQLSREAIEADIREAAAGDARAAGRILSDLAGGDRHVQSRVGAAILTAAERGFWEHLLEFASLGIWAGKKVSLPASVTSDSLRPRLAGLFLARHDGPSAAARHDAMIAALSNRDPTLRRFIADLLRQWRGPVDLKALEPLLHDPDTGVRLRAARALGRIGDPQAVPALIDALGHSDDLVAGEAADALARIGEPALEPLMKALQQKDPRVRWHAAKALAEMANPRAADALIATLDDEDFGVRWYASNGLAAMGTRGLIPLLRALRTREITPWVAEGAIHVLKNVKDPNLVILVEELERRLWDTYANVEVPIEADRVLRKLEETDRHEARSL